MGRANNLVAATLAFGLLAIGCESKPMKPSWCGRSGTDDACLTDSDCRSCECSELKCQASRRNPYKGSGKRCLSNGECWSGECTWTLKGKVCE